MREWRTKSEVETKELTAKHGERLKSAFAEYHGEAVGRLDDMKIKHEAILEIHGLVGTDGVAGGYQKGATDEHASANLWRVISMFMLAIAAVWIGIKIRIGFGITPAGSLNWAEVITATSLTLGSGLVLVS